uniref:Glycosyl transferase CAP10 domain-containing protein n=1 Tax=Quercus lobata TaxID=97700 RepID=A0A7N2ME31_QUELO
MRRKYGSKDWEEESKQGFKNSKLEDQCTHRYKIYIEGKTWSVSEKYILACNSMTLLLMPQYHDFFTRSLVPMQHYWPIKITNNTCRDLKLAVEWGNYVTDKVNLSYSLPLLTQSNLTTCGHACVVSLFS